MTSYNIDIAHSSADFSVRHMMVSTVRGSFQDVTGTIEFDPANVAASKVEANIGVASIQTGVADRDAHLRSADFFDAENHPTLHFVSTRVVPTGENEANIEGNLTIRGTTLPVTLKAEYLGEAASPFGDVRAGFVATTKVDREAFGLTWNVALEAGGVLVGKEIKIELNLEAIKVAETVQA